MITELTTAPWQRKGGKGAPRRFLDPHQNPISKIQAPNPHPRTPLGKMKQQQRDDKARAQKGPHVQTT